MKLYQYIDDIVIGGISPEKLGEVAAAVWQALTKAVVEVPPEKCQGPSREVKFLGTWWTADSAAIPLDTLNKMEQLQMSQSGKEFQQFLGTLGTGGNMDLDFPSLLINCIQFYEREDHGNGSQNMKRQSKS